MRPYTDDLRRKPPDWRRGGIAAATVLLPMVPGAARAVGTIETRNRSQTYYKDWGNERLRETISAGARALARERRTAESRSRSLEAQGLMGAAWSRRWASYLMAVNE